MQEKTIPEKPVEKAAPATVEKKKKTWKGRLLTFLMYGWMLILIFIMGMIILISSLVNSCQKG